MSGTAPTRLVVDALTKAHGDSHRAESGLKELSRFQTCVLRTSVVKTVDGAPVVKPTLVTLQAKPRHSLIPSLLELNAKNATIRVASSDNAASASSGDVTVTSRGEFLPHQLSAAVSNELRLFDSTKVIKPIALMSPSDGTQEKLVFKLPYLGMINSHPLCCLFEV